MLRKFLIAGCTGVLMLSVGCRKAVEEQEPAPDTAEAGFVQIFNGKDLTGWETSGEAKWVVEDGMLVGTQGDDNAPGDLFTEDTYFGFARHPSMRDFARAST